MCDARDRYVMSRLSYVRKASPNGEVPTSEYCLEDLTKPLHHINAKVAYGNWFTTIPATKNLLKDYGIASVGTLKKIKTEIPKSMLTTKGRPVHVYKLVTFCPKREKVWHHNQICTRYESVINESFLKN